ncbi:MAG: hypothetical protein FWC41_06915, partial [Firmicutes bacterium]|nr:hypothetical protein [Bacillota bacterium]
MARNLSKQSKTTAGGVINFPQFNGEITEESFLLWFNKHIKKYYTIQETDALLLQNLIASKAYTDEKLSLLIQQFYTKLEIDAKILGLQTQIDAISGDFDTSNLVTLNTQQTITVRKTFDVLPESSAIPTVNNQLVNKKYVDDEIINAVNGDIDLSGFVDTSTNQSIDGIKVFIQPVYSPNPIFDSHLATKAYVDMKVVESGGFDSLKYYTRD